MKSRDNIWAAIRFWETRGKVLLVFWYVQGSIYIMWNFKMKGMPTDKFYRLYKGPEAHAKVQPSKLPYPAHNTCCTLVWPLQYLQIAGPVSGWSGMLMRPRAFDIPTCRCPQQLFYRTAGVLRSAELGTATSARWRPKVTIIGNH